MLATPPENVDRSLWLYELCRFLVQKVNNLIVGFFSDAPPCSALNCPEMRASEWQYLCAVHDPPKSCCAIDYCCHTLDWAANILTSQKHFPSRLTLGSDASGGGQQSVRHLTNVFRRVYRMFAHAWFQHRDVFWAVESHEGLYIFYKTVCDVYNLIPEDNYTVPKEAEGTEGDEDHSRREEPSERIPFNPSMRHPGVMDDDKEVSTPIEEGDDITTISTGATTRRHKHTPSIGSFVTTIAEGDEENEEPKIEGIKRTETMQKVGSPARESSSPPLPPTPGSSTEQSTGSSTQESGRSSESAGEEGRNEIRSDESIKKERPEDEENHKILIEDSHTTDLRDSGKDEIAEVKEPEPKEAAS